MNAAAGRRRRVTIVKANVKQFRLPFFARLHELLAADGVDLTVVYSAPSASEARKGDCVELPASFGHRAPRHYFAGDRVLVQWPAPADLLAADLVIAVNANGYLLNLPLLLASRLGLKKVALWGHAYNAQGRAGSVAERLKRRLVRQCDWWFAYTADTARYLASLGFPPGRITAVENAVDTAAFRAQLASIGSDELDAMRAELGLAADHRIALYCGSFYEEKRLPFLIDAAQRIARDDPGFRLLLVGDGPLGELVGRAAVNNPALIPLGPQFGRRKAICFRLAQLFVNPGLTGLAILDSFAAGLPFLTTAEALHSPEIAYLEPGGNGLMISGDAALYADEVKRLLQDPQRIRALSTGALTAAGRYTLENMVGRVRDGILACLQQAKR